MASTPKSAGKKLVRLVVMIPAYNEEATIESVIQSVPRTMPDVNSIQILVIDDGSTDLTASLARNAGAVVQSNRGNRGLAYTFSRGLEFALEMGADVIVNTDADNQYDQSQIPALVQPVLSGKADMVLGSRFAGRIEKMSFGKFWGNRLASWTVARVSGLRITDGQTGFRAFSREAAMKLNVFSNFTYTQETILEAADKGLRVVEIPCTFRKRADRNRLFSSVWNYALRASSTLVIGNLKYHPITSFGIAGGIFMTGGILIGLPVLDNYFTTGQIGSAYILRAVATGIFIIIGVEIAALGFIGALLKQNRRIAERQLLEAKRARFDSK